MSSIKRFESFVNEGEVQIEKWGDDYHITKGDGKAITVDGESVFSTTGEAQEALTRYKKSPSGGNASFSGKSKPVRTANGLEDNIIKALKKCKLEPDQAVNILEDILDSIKKNLEIKMHQPLDLK